MCMFSVVYSFVMVVPIYTMVGLQQTTVKFLFFLSIVTIMTAIGAVLGVIVGATSRDLLEAQNKLAPSLAPLILFSGWVIPKNQLAWYFKWIYDISFIQYALTAMQVNELTGLILTYDLVIPPIPNITNTSRHVEIPITGEWVLEHALHIDPNTSLPGILLLLTGMLFAIITLGYWVIRSDLSRKTG